MKFRQIAAKNSDEVSIRLKMRVKAMNSPTVLSFRTRLFLGGICIFLTMLLIVGAAGIPFLFESPSIFYKFGINKTFLRIGKILGVTAGVLVFYQAFLVSRLKILDRIFSLNRIYSLHRINGITLAALAVIHPILILASENFTLFPIEKRYWPEFLGAAVLVLIVILVVTANWRLIFDITYEKWLRFHRLGTMLAVTLMFIHILFVSDTFKSGLPRVLVFVGGGMNLVLILRIWFRRFFPGKRRFAVFNVEPVGRNAYFVSIRPYKEQGLNYIPGQFAFITPVSEHVPKEEHPFTLSSSPSRPDTLQFVIRTMGDWTNKINHLRAGEVVSIDGPYGLFSHLVWPGNDEIIMIAGGIGITPMLSMLRYMADTKDQRRVLLIWSNKTLEDIVFPEEFEDLEHRLQGFRMIHVITRNAIGGNKKTRIDKAFLEQVLAECSRKSRIFVCGPSGMMNDVRRALKKIGFSSARVYKEEFKL